MRNGPGGPAMMATACDVAFVRRMLHRETGVVLGEDKDYLVRSLLAPVARREGAATLAALVDRLKGDAAEALRRVVVEALLNNETWFFREPSALRLVAERLVPERAAARPGPVRVWSAACSSGQEPFSLALELRERAPDLAGCVRLLASDLSSRALARAAEGRYSRYEINRGLPARLLVRWFEEDGADWRLCDEVRASVRFFRHDLTAGTPLPAIDVALLRNALIYFDDATRRTVLAGVRASLAPGGYLVLGRAEAALDVGPDFVPTSAGGVPCYRVPAEPEGPA